MKFIITKIKEDGTDARPFIVELEEVMHFISIFTINKQNTFKIEKIAK